MADVNEWNTQIIAEFRANEGRVGGPFEGQPVVLIHHKGRRSGAPRVNPVVYQKVDGGWAVFASYAGAPKHPDWYFNLMDEPRTTIEIGTETLEVVARDTSGAERDEIWEKQKAASPGFADYEVLEPAG
jgi:deazaflavin-dependent oxidoreductase (nitroreductase family)